MNETPMSPDAALARLQQYRGEDTFRVATYGSGTERALHEIATALGTEVTRLRSRVDEVVAQRDDLLVADALAERERDEQPEGVSALRAEVTRLRAELAAQSPAEALRDAAEAIVVDQHERDDKVNARLGFLDHAAELEHTTVHRVVRQLHERADAKRTGEKDTHAGESTPQEPLLVHRFDVAIEPAPEEDPVLLICAVARGGRPVALQLDPRDRVKVAGWLIPDSATADTEGSVTSYGLPWLGWLDDAEQEEFLGEIASAALGYYRAEDDNGGVLSDVARACATYRLSAEATRGLLSAPGPGAEEVDREDESGPCDCGEGTVHYTAADCPFVQRAAERAPDPEASAARLRGILAPSTPMQELIARQRGDAGGEGRG